MKGKNYSTNKKQNKRNNNDYYPTPKSMVWQLLEEYCLPTYFNYYEPATGKDRSIENELKKKGYKIEGTDIIYGNDFLKSTKKHEIIITNPPFKLFNEFVLKCNKLSTQMFILLGKLDFLSGLYRYDNFYNNGLKPTDVYIFVRKPMLSEKLRNDGKYGCGIDAYCWYIFNKNYYDGTRLYWINNQKYMLNKNDKKNKINKEKLF